MNLKQNIFEKLQKVELPFELTANALQPLLTENVDAKNGEVSLPCFTLSKTLRKSPVEIASELTRVVNGCKFNELLEVVAVNGYVNFFFKRDYLVNSVLEDILKSGNQFGKQKIGNGKTVFIDFSSVNLAKYMHIGHLKTTMIGWALYKIYDFLGYNVVRINYVGDYGTPFGKMIAGYKHWGNHEDVLARGVDAIQDLYVKFNQEAEKDETLNDEAREWFYKIENKDPEAVKLFNWFLEIGIAEVKRICDILGVTFDSWRGENYYSDKMQPVLDELTQKGLLKESEGATIVDLSQFNLGVALIKKSDGSSLYTTRDLATVQDRYNNYKFDKGFYVTSVQQKLHFERLFKIVEAMEKPYANTLEHIYYGTYSLPSGKIGSRFGKQAIISDILKAAKEQAMNILISRGTKHENMDEVAQKIAVGALAFEVVKIERIKDSIFDLDNAINFEGETSPYLQYTFARACSIVDKVNDASNVKEIKNTEYNDEYFSLTKLLNKFPNIVLDCANLKETYLLTKLLLNISSDFNKFYAFNRILDNEVVNTDNLNLVKAVKIVLESGLTLLGIPLIQKM